MNITKWFLEYGNRDLSCRPPCSLYSVLLDNKLIDDPYYRENERLATPLSDKDCTFKAIFIVDEAAVAREFVRLRFYGIDTLCTIYLNDVKIGEADNMHRTWEFDIKSAVTAGENLLRLEFHSPSEYIRREQEKYYIWGDANSGDGISHMRKASCMFGWDWSPTLPDMGLFRPVELLSYNICTISEVELRQHHGDGNVSLEIIAKTTAVSEKAALECSLVSPAGEVQSLRLARRGNMYTGNIDVKNPQLWWPRGLGDQPLYKLETSLLLDGAVKCRDEKLIGLRTLTVSQKPDKWGREFCFVANGVKFFAMGADYIPEDSILARVSRERTEKLIRSCAEANFNCLRVWGGGHYPGDDFYDLCDKWGIVVWQDFMFACMNVRLTRSFEENITAEFRDNIRRLRHHASLGLMCGNNEMELAVKTWGIADSELVRQDYLRLYERLLPDLMEELAPDVFYWPASPSSGGGFDDPNDENRGDNHYWGAWHGSIPFESYRSYYFRFCSEFGFEAFPNMKTICSFALESDMNPFSRVMEAHQKCKSGNQKMLTYAADKYLYPAGFERFVYTTQILQADAIRYGVEHFRRYRGRCMGAVYWQLNDCWPVASWSSVDYYGRPKALHYAARRFFAPVLLSAHEDGCDVTLNVSNETRSEAVCRVSYWVSDNDFNIYYSGISDVRIPALTSRDICTLGLGEYIADASGERYLAYRMETQCGELISFGSVLFEKPKFFAFKKPDIKAEISEENGDFTALVTASHYARCVELDFAELDVKLSDNYFDIIDGSGVEIKLTAESGVTAMALSAALRVQSVYDIDKLPER